MRTHPKRCRSLVPAGVALAVLLGACGDGGVRAGGGYRLDVGAEDPAEFGSLPAFALTSQEGERVTGETLAGRPFAMGAIFTSCVGPCPAISRNMQALQAELAGTDARLVSITVDPAHDSPEVLRAYADSYDADPARWLFLTGSEEAVDALVRGGFKMAVDRAGADDAPAGQRVTHDTRLVAVDARGRIRGWYDGRSEAGLRALGARMHYLAGEGRAEPAGGAARR